MWRAATLAALLSLTFSVGAFPPASAASPSDLTAIPAGKTDKHAQGDYDGDGLVDQADFFERADGFLILVVRLAAAPDAPIEIWSGELSRFPQALVSAAPPGTYQTLCYLYGGCEGRVPAEVTSTHNGIVVRESNELGRNFYFYWDGAHFRDILIAECAACADVNLPPAGYAPIPASESGKHARGDYDGDGQIDRADFFESNEGVLTLLVRRAAAPNAPANIWGGDIASFPFFDLSTAPPGTYRTMCHVYGEGACGTTVPEQVTLMHDGIIVHALEGPAEFLYYWDGSTFQNIIISE